MKTYALSIAMLILNLNDVSGEIKNGYETEITNTREALKSLGVFLANDKTSSPYERTRMKKRMETMLNYVTYYELTQNLIEQLRTVAPDLYNEINAIRDSKGRLVDVYVKFLPEEMMQGGISGTTNLEQSEQDRDAYNSEYGSNTVSVRISAVKKALMLLAHEFGHVSYQVPNLASYMEFYSKSYQEYGSRSIEKGHDANDPSGQSARAFELRFQQSYLGFLEISEDRFESPMAIVLKIRRSLLE